MASVSSLDKDLRNMRFDKYTPARANEIRGWIEGTLGERLAAGDLLEALKDGTALCKLVNLAVPGAIRFKASAMPFVQMENISHFLRACQDPPLNLAAHDCFLTVDLYESKDPAQVLQCIEAFSRVASGLAPNKIPKPVGNLKSVASPQATGPSNGMGHSRGMSNTSNPASGRASPVKSGRISPVKTGGPLSPSDNAPAWNYTQYGWTGGASQGNQGISFGARRQITSAAPHVPSLAEKERLRKEKAAEAERARLELENEERKRRAEREAEEERAQAEEARRWAEETRKLKEKEQRDAEAERRRWQEDERRWRQEEERRAQEEQDVEARLEKERLRKAANDKPRLQGQMLSQYQAEQKTQHVSEGDRIRDLERQLEQAKERERQYERERQERNTIPEPTTGGTGSGRPSLSSTENTPELGAYVEEDSIQDSERDFLATSWSAHQALQSQSPRPLPIPTKAAAPAPIPAQAPAPAPMQTPARKPAPVDAIPTQSPRPLPNPANYTSPASAMNTPSRTDRYLASNPAPASVAAAQHIPSEAVHSSRSEEDAEAQRRQAAQDKTKAGGWASKSLLEREMERERQRQREWEEGQRATQQAVADGRVDPSAGSGPGASWDVHQYGYTGGDNLNQGGGVYMGRRQILGPRPLGSKGG